MAALRNGDLRERHWGLIGDALGITLDQREEMTMAAALQLGVVDHRERLVQISYEASQEAALEGMLGKVAGR